MAEIARATAGDTSPRERFRKVARAVQEMQSELDTIFVDLSRIVASVKLAWMRPLGLLTDEEFLEFGEGFRAVVDPLLEL